MEKNYSIILGIICHSLRMSNPSEHVPKYPIINFWDPKGKYFLSLSHSYNINYDFEKYSSIILATICQRFRHFNPSVCIPKYPFVIFWEPKGNYFFSLTDSCNINYKHTHTKILATICQRFRHFKPSVCIPKYIFINFWDPKGNYFLVWHIHVTLTINMKKKKLNNFRHHLSQP